MSGASATLAEPRLRSAAGQPEPPAQPTVAEAVPTPARSPRAARRVRLVALLLLLAAAAAGARMWWHAHHYVSTENAHAAGHVHPVSARVAGVVIRMAVDDNQVVAAGDLIAELDPVDQRLRIEHVEAQIAAARASGGVPPAQVEVLKVQLKEAQQQLTYHRITAPVAGRVGKRSAELGQRVQPGQALAAIVQEGLWITANFKETQLADLRPGLAARVVFDALPDHPLEGRIDSLAPASGAQFALLPTDNATGNFTKIVQRVSAKVLLKPEDLRALRGVLVPGMSALVEVRRPSAEKP